MSKHHKQTHPSPAKKPAKPAGSGAFTFMLRNLAVLAVFAVLILGVDRMNQKQGELDDKYREFQQLRQSGANQERLQELYSQIMAIQNDTSYFKKLTRGYYWAVHDIAIKGSENVKEMESKADKPLTREDKLAMRIGIWKMLEYINKSTPPDAVIYLPKADTTLTNNGNWNYIYHPGWMEYFLYPRLCVAIGKEEEHPDLAKRATHVVILQGKGYEKLKYEVPEEQRSHEMLLVLPVNRPQTKIQP